MYIHVRTCTTYIHACMHTYIHTPRSLPAVTRKPQAAGATTVGIKDAHWIDALLRV